MVLEQVEIWVIVQVIIVQVLQEESQEDEALALEEVEVEGMDGDFGVEIFGIKDTIQIYIMNLIRIDRLP
jgi:hypothetical protein